MTLEQVINEFKEKPYMLKMGKGLLAKRLKTTADVVVEAKKKVRNSLTLKDQKSEVKILILDIETSPMQAYVWKRWRENISLDQTISEWFILCWSAKWLDSNETFGDVLTPEEVEKEDDMRICYSLWHALNDADIVIAHNGNRFDIPKINSRFIVNGFLPPAPYRQIDTLEVAKKTFGFSSNKLDAFAGYFGIVHKDPTDFNLWKRCMNGDKAALSYMYNYNKKDVEILESVYMVLRPWIKNHPNIATITMAEDNVCPICGKKDLMELPNKFIGTNVSQYQVYRCRDCRAVVRGREKINEKVKLITI